MNLYAQPVKFCVISTVILLSCKVLSLTGCSNSDQTNGANNTVASSATVNSVSPGEAKVGETITVTGQNFGASQGTSRLNINGVTATQITSWTDSQIVATVPVDAGTGNVTVSVNGLAGAPGFLIVPWQAENPVNVAISQAANGQFNAQLISDGAGGRSLRGMISEAAPALTSTPRG